MPVLCGRLEDVRGMGNALSFPGTVEELVEAVGHHEVHTDEVVDGSEASNRDVTLAFAWSWSAFMMRDKGSLWTDSAQLGRAARVASTLYWTG